MLLLDGTLGADIVPFLTQLQEDSLACTIMMYDDWIQKHASCGDHHHDHPDGIIYVRVSPEIAYNRIKKQARGELSITLDNIESVYTEKEKLFIANKNSPKTLQYLPVLVLNGNIDFQTDFAQYYNHLFYIKRFINQLDEKKQIALGIYKEKVPHRHCC